MVDLIIGWLAQNIKCWTATLSNYNFSWLPAAWYHCCKGRAILLVEYKLFSGSAFYVLKCASGQNSEFCWIPGTPLIDKTRDFRFSIFFKKITSCEKREPKNGKNYKIREVFVPDTCRFNEKMTLKPVINRCYRVIIIEILTRPDIWHPVCRRSCRIDRLNLNFK